MWDRKALRTPHQRFAGVIMQQAHLQAQNFAAWGISTIPASHSRKLKRVGEPRCAGFSGSCLLGCLEKPSKVFHEGKEGLQGLVGMLLGLSQPNAEAAGSITCLGSLIDRFGDRKGIPPAALKLSSLRGGITTIPSPHPANQKVGEPTMEWLFWVLLAFFIIRWLTRKPKRQQTKTKTGVLTFKVVVTKDGRVDCKQHYEVEG